MPGEGHPAGCAAYVRKPIDALTIADLLLAQLPENHP